MPKKLDDADSPLPESTGNDRLNVSQAVRMERVAVCLATGKTVASVARECEVGEKTIWVWLRKDKFRERVEELRREMTSRAIGRLSDIMAGKALDVLIARLDKVDDETGQTAATLEDVKAAFDLYGGLRSNQELAEKLDRLAEKLGQGAEGNA